MVRVNTAVARRSGSVSVCVPKRGSCSYEKRTDEEIREVLEKLTSAESDTLVPTTAFVEHFEKFQVLQEKLLGMCLKEYIDTHEDDIQPEVIRNIFKQVVEGIMCLHRMGLVHGNLSEENVGFVHDASLCTNVFRRFQVAIAGTHNSYMCVTSEADKRKDFVDLGRLLYRLHTKILLPKDYDFNQVDFSKFHSEELVALSKTLLNPPLDCTAESVYSNEYFYSVI